MTIINNKNLAILIPAAGRGTRSKLNYPKTFYKVNKLPIIIRIIKKLTKYSDNFSLVINSKFKDYFIKTLDYYNISQIEYLFQNNPNGMGDAVKKFNKSKFNRKITDILLIWSDIPYISRSSIDSILRTHFKENNFMTILSYNCKNPYTFINKDKNGFVKSITETHKNKKKFKYGERDIGVFVFKKELIGYLSHNSSLKKEHNFLYVISKLYKKGFKIKSLPIAKTKETISLNYINDLL
jgi:bifunctional N-acetylglucosamine-1-phosphate-uridyltransferase/glucosamine-1-phosphate-acetyltransferase GlmU-like protein